MTDREKAAAILAAHSGDALDALVTVMRERAEAVSDLGRLNAALTSIANLESQATVIARSTLSTNAPGDNLEKQCPRCGGRPRARCLTGLGPCPNYSMTVMEIFRAVAQGEMTSEKGAAMLERRKQ